MNYDDMAVHGGKLSGEEMDSLIEKLQSVDVDFSPAARAALAMYCLNQLGVTPAALVEYVIAHARQPLPALVNMTSSDTGMIGDDGEWISFVDEDDCFVDPDGLPPAAQALLRRARAKHNGEAG